MNKKKEETQENLDLLEDLKKELLTIYEKNTVYDLISAKSFNYIFYLKKDLKNFESDIASLKNFNNYLSSNATTNFIRSKETDIKKISPGYSPSAYQIFLFFNLLLISIFVIFYIYNIKKDD